MARGSRWGWRVVTAMERSSAAVHRHHRTRAPSGPAALERKSSLLAERIRVCALPPRARPRSAPRRSLADGRIFAAAMRCSAVAARPPARRGGPPAPPGCKCRMRRRRRRPRRFRARDGVLCRGWRLHRA